MAKKLQTYEIDRGTEYTLGYAHEHNGVSFPLTGCTLYFTMKPLEYDSDLTDGAAVIKRTLTNLSTSPNYFKDAANGIAQIVFTDTETQLDPTIVYYGDIKIEEPGRVGAIKVFEAKFTIGGSATNRNLSNG